MCAEHIYIYSLYAEVYIYLRENTRIRAIYAVDRVQLRQVLMLKYTYTSKSSLNFFRAPIYQVYIYLHVGTSVARRKRARRDGSIEELYSDDVPDIANRMAKSDIYKYCTCIIYMYIVANKEY